MTNQIVSELPQSVLQFFSSEGSDGFTEGLRLLVKEAMRQERWGGDPAKRKGRPPTYDKAVADVFRSISKVSEYPCGKRLAEMRKL